MTTRRTRDKGALGVLVVVASLLVAACTEPIPDAAAPSTTAAPVTVVATTMPSTMPSSGSPSTVASTIVAVTSTVPAPAGEPFVVGVVNTEGVPGLDFPEFADAFRAAAAYANAELGGFGGRPVELRVCIAKGSPESSQACAQELAAAEVELAMIGFDLFVDYGTFAAAGIPVIGAVPVLPPDYTADAVYITAGNLVVQGATAVAITDPAHLGLTRVAVIANDTPATVSALASFEPALARGGATVTVIKGGETETDAGFRSLMQQAAAIDPEVIVSMYGQAGCVGLMRARVDLGLTMPAFSNTSCLGDAVIDAVGDAAIGWYFAGATGGPETPDSEVMRRYVGEVTGTPAEDVDRYGFTSLGWLQALTIQQVAASLGPAVTGLAIFDAFTAGTAVQWGGAGALDCGSVPSLPAVCSFAIPFAQYTAEGPVAAFGGTNVSALSVLDT